ncbi:MAG TPA: NUDIX hydrolase, partial [Oscillatoriaceae cyanobacterium]
PGERPEQAAGRELTEETGCAGTLRYLGCMYSSPGFTNEALYLFAASELTRGAARPESDEFIDTQALTLDEALACVHTGAIVDAKTIAGLLWIRQFGLAGAQSLPASGTLDDPDAS